MVVRSLVLKIYLYAIVVFALSIPMAMAVGQNFREMGRHEVVRLHVGPQFTYIKREVEHALQDGAPDPARLAELSEAFRHDLRFVPWGERGGYPAELARQVMMVDERPPHEGPVHWVRLERAGAPLGALELRPTFGRMRRPMPPPPPPRGPFVPQLAWIWVLLLVVMIVPPLWLWVIRPLRRMEAVASRLGGGDLETPVPVTRRDEFGALERAFEGMRGELHRVLKQKEQLLTDVSHEVRGPLARMTLALPLLRQQGVSGPVADIFERELKAADELLGEVLTLARGRALPPAAMGPVDLAAIARQLVDERMIVADQQAQTLEAHLEPAPASGDERLLARALGNLLDNALKYTPDGGTIRVASGLDGSDVVFRVEDDGIGIAAEHLPQIFEPFYRPDDSRSRETGGTGLGLAIVRGIVERHGGTVTLVSHSGDGTTAELRLPALGGLG